MGPLCWDLVTHDRQSAGEVKGHKKEKTNMKKQDHQKNEPVDKVKQNAKRSKEKNRKREVKQQQTHVTTT
ncbi:hypothetical protein CEXT_768141 [Caerostris extrusa]|uniref:Uncharacterized protein n=1 Tax=Caerostris extrusa TaxID=172846 RepID=A0AAV4NCC4_CAEEX|nr:hypothetical protein CEXT_768141 [Caerostris extrusa]